MDTDRLTTSAEIGALAAALAKAQAVMTGARRDSTNPHFRSQYADLESTWEAVRGPLTANGLAVIQSVSADGARVTVETMLVHSSGQWVRFAASAEAANAGPQPVGSVTTYLRRYGLQAVAGVAPTDDDGNAGQRPAPEGAWAAISTRPPEPAGYAAWLDGLQPAANAGKLGDLWRDPATEHHRAHLTSTDPQRFADLKAKSSAVKKMLDAVKKREPGEEG